MLYHYYTERNILCLQPIADCELHSNCEKYESEFLSFKAFSLAHIWQKVCPPYQFIKCIETFLFLLLFILLMSW